MDAAQSVGQRGDSLEKVISGALLLLSLLCSCDRPTTTLYVLPSGRELDVYNAEVRGEQWALSYQTRLPLNNELVNAHGIFESYPGEFQIPSHLQSQVHALQCEVEELLDDVQLEAQAAGVKKVVISPASNKIEFVYPGVAGVVDTIVWQAISFTLEQDEFGIWRKCTGWIEVNCQDDAAELSVAADDRLEV